MMKVRMSLVLGLLLVSITGAADLVANGGFETPEDPAKPSPLAEGVRPFYAGTQPSPFAGWRFGGRYENGRYSVHASTESRSGRLSCEIRCERKGRGGIASPPFTLRPGTILSVSLWIRARGAEGGRVFLNFEGSPGDGWHHVDLPRGTYDWTKVTRRCVVPVRHERADGQTLVLFIYSKATGSTWIDDVTVETVDVNALAEAPDTPALAPPRPKAIAEPEGSVGYRVDVASALEKVLPDTDYARTPRARASLAMARNEYEAVQVVVEAPWRDVRIRCVTFSDLKGPGGQLLPASALNWRRVDFVETAIAPLYPVDRVGLYPDPLMPAGPFTVTAPFRVPVWVDVRTAKDTAPGIYRGAITVEPEGLRPTRIPLTVTVWDFALPDETHLRTLTWLGTGVVRAFYGLKWSPEANRMFEETIQRYQDMLLEHRLGPGGEVVSRVQKNRKTGRYDFSHVDRNLERLLGKGMNAFIMGTAPNLKRAGKKEYSSEFIASFTEMLKAYGDHLRAKGWIDRAYVYTYDEAPRFAWPEVRKVAKAIRSAAPELRILQCLNQPDGVKALAGAVDVFDVYIGQYHRTGVASLQRRGTEVWLAVCCYPMDHPNLFIEYPLLDARIIPMFCWKYGARGFEYWSPNSWGRNWRQKKPNQWPDVPWDPNTFGRYNGDGYLLYPGPDGVPYPSIRLRALRDGFEDYEYMWALNRMARQAPSPSVKALLGMDALIRDDGSFANDAEKYFTFRAKVAEAIVNLKRLGAAE